ncbi:MAG: response regulator [Deltaproteobacteria bacterium]|nr:response regulator [Deltaproteobacteria bacterium]
MPNETPILIYVVDDDASVRAALTMLFRSAEMEVKTFEAAEDFLNCQLREQNACLISDIKLKGLSGIELQQQLAERGIQIPVIFLTAFDSNEIRQQTKQAGAAGYFRKPVDDQALLDAIHWAISGCVLSE